MFEISRRLFLASSSSAAFLVARPGFAAAPVEPASKRGGLVIGTIGFSEPQSIFVAGGSGGSSTFPASKILQRLFRLNRDLSVAPVLAEFWAPSNNFQSFAIQLRRGVTWHDGKDFTADDVAFCIDHIWRPVSPGGVLNILDKVETTGPHGVVIHFQRPVPEESVLAILHENFIVPKHLYETGSFFSNPANNAPIGTGPWKFKRWVRGSHVELVPNENYWIKEQPYLDQLVIRWWRDAVARVAALETGEADIGVSAPVSLHDIKRLEDNPKLKVVWDDSGNTFCSSIIFNVRNPILGKREVRQALLHAIDRDFLAKTIYFGYGQPPIGPIMRTNKRYFTDDVPRYAFDPAKAAELLDKAGYPVQQDGKRFSLTLVVAGGSEDHANVGAYLKQVFDDLAIPTKLKVPDRETSYKLIYTDYDFDVAYSWGGGSSLDPVPALTQLYTTAGIAKGIIFRNASGFSSPEMDALVEALTYEVNPDRRRQLVQQFARLAGTEVPSFPLAERPSYSVVRNDVHIPSEALAPWADDWGDAWSSR